MTRLDCEREALLADVLAEPASDVPRLIYADWLDENGEASRAEFIRVQIELAEAKHWNHGIVDWSNDDDRFAACLVCRACWLKRREEELFEEHSANERWGIDGFVGKIAGVLRRGFVGHVECKLAAWLDHGREVVRAHPVTRVVAVGRSAELRSDGVSYAWYAYGNPHGKPSFEPWEDESDAVPYELGKLLRPERPYGYFRYDSQDAAIDALSDALLEYARG